MRRSCSTILGRLAAGLVLAIGLSLAAAGCAENKCNPSQCGQCASGCSKETCAKEGCSKDCAKCAKAAKCPADCKKECCKK